MNNFGNVDPSVIQQIAATGYNFKNITQSVPGVGIQPVDLSSLPKEVRDIYEKGAGAQPLGVYTPQQMPQSFGLNQGFVPGMNADALQGTPLQPFAQDYQKIQQQINQTQQAIGAVQDISTLATLLAALSQQLQNLIVQEQQVLSQQLAGKNFASLPSVPGFDPSQFGGIPGGIPGGVPGGIPGGYPYIPVPMPLPQPYPSVTPVPLPPVAPPAGPITIQQPEPAKPLLERDPNYLDPFDPLKTDIKKGIDEILERNKAIDAERQKSKTEYALGEHGLGKEIINQAWNNLKENLGNAKTAIVTGGKAVYDVAVKAPVIALKNTGKAIVQAAGETVAPIVNNIKQGVSEIQQRHTQVNADRQKSKEEYATGQHGLVKEVANQAWNNLKENVGNTYTAVKTGAKVAVNTITAPIRFLGNTAKHILGFK